MKRWDDISGLNLVQIGDIGEQTRPADITLSFDDLKISSSGHIGYANYFYTIDKSGKQVFLPGVSIHLQDPRITSLNLVNEGELDFKYDGYDTTLYQVVLHEIGHALGLGHSNDGHSSMFAIAGPQSRDLSAYDIAGIQHLYGPQTTNSMTTSNAFIAISDQANNTSMASIKAASIASPITFLSSDAHMKVAGQIFAGKHGAYGSPCACGCSGSSKIDSQDLVISREDYVKHANGLDSYEYLGYEDSNYGNAEKIVKNPDQHYNTFTKPDVNVYFNEVGIFSSC